ncbi:MAG: serine/threonine-protein kinase [Planctomycetaceae bacterium]|nr:serine/threonine-protein kinase [Planctomycetaceae bacterium]
MTSDSSHPEIDSLELARRMDPVLDRFEQQWQQGSPPSLESCLQDFEPPSCRGQLLNALLEIELELRTGREQVSISDYLDRFPDHQVEVRNAFRTNSLQPTFCMPLTIRCPDCQTECEVESSAVEHDLTCRSCLHTFRLVGEDAAGLRAGDTIAHFVLEEELGRGSFGSVWKASDPKLDRHVAVKVPRRGSLSVEDTREFLKDAQSAAQLKHPNIVAVHEVGQHADSVYIVSELIDGVTLTEWIIEHRPNVREAVQMTHTIALALAHAHAAGVIHRDLKPDNVMVDRHGQPHLIDFGLARRIQAENSVSDGGRILGTPAYMAPEQAKGESHLAAEPADVYSLGVVLFQLLTGDRPFRGEMQALIASVIRQEAPAPSSLTSGVPKDLDNVCLKCLQKLPVSRYASAQELADDLNRFLKGEPVLARPVSAVTRFARWCRRRPTVATLSAVLLLVVMGLAIGGPIVAGYQAMLVRRESEAHAQTRQARNLADAARMAEESARQKAEAATIRARADRAEARRQRATLEYRTGIAALERDGDAALGLLWLSRAMTTEITADATPDSAAELIHRTRLAWVTRLAPRLKHVWYSPDLGVRRGTFHTLDYAGGALVAWRTYNGTAFVLNAATGEVVCGPLIHEGGLTGIALSADQRLLATIDMTNTLTIRRIPSGQTVATGKTDGRGQTVKFSPGSDQLMVASPKSISLWKLPLEILTDGESLPSEPMLLEPMATRSGAGKYTTAAFSPDGQWLATGGRLRRGIPLISTTDGSKTTDILVGREFRTLQALTFGPQSGRMAFVTDEQLVVLTNVEPPRDRQKALGGFEQTRQLQFSPDGDRLVVPAALGARVLSADDATDITPLLKHSERCFRARFSHDGRHIVTCSIDHTARVWDADTGLPVCGPLYHADNVWDAWFVDSDRSEVVTCSRDGTARVWDWQPDFDRTDIPSGMPAISLVSVSEKAGMIATADQRRIQVQQLSEPFDNVLEFDAAAPPAQLELSPSGETLLFIDESGDLSIVSTETGTVVFHSREDAGRSNVRVAAFTSDGRHVVYGQSNRVSVVTVDGTLLHERIDCPGETVIRVLTACPHAELMTVAAEARPRVLNVVTGEWIRTLDDSRGVATHVAVSGDGSRICVTSRQGACWLHNINDDNATTVFQQAVPQVRSLVFSHDDRLVVSGHLNGTVRLTDTDSGALRQTPIIHEGLTTVAVSPDGSLLLTGGNGVVRAWHLSTCQQLSAAIKVPGEVLDIQFLSDGRFLTIATRGAVVLTPPQPLQQPRSAIDAHVLSVTGHEFSEPGVVQAATAAAVVASFQLAAPTAASGKK